MTAPLHVVAPYGPTGSSTRVRALDWLSHLGMEARLSTYLGTATTGLDVLRRRPGAVAAAEVRLRQLRSELRHSSLLLVRNATPLSNGGVEASLLHRAEHGVYDFDDALMLQQSGPANKVFSRARAWRRSVGAADVVIAGNDYLADAASAHHSRVVVVPSCVEPDAYTAKTTYDLGDPPLAVWLGSPSTEPYLGLLANALLAEHKRSGLRLRVISAGTATLGALDAITDRVAWVPGLAERSLADADFGLMPLPDDPWARGKCAYKLLQYAAAGLPVVGSPVGVNSAVLGTLGGLAAASDDQWRQAVEAIVTMSVTERASLGAQSRAGVIAEFSFVRWAGTWRGLVMGDLAPPAV